MCWAKTGMLQNGDFDEKIMIIKLENDDKPLDFRSIYPIWLWIYTYKNHNFAAEFTSI